MDKIFRDHVESLRPKLDELLSRKCGPVCERIKKLLPERGVYVLSEGPEYVYVGRSNAIHQRLNLHCRKSSNENSASFAFLLTRDQLEFKRHQFTRKELMDKNEFCVAFQSAKERIEKMTLRYVEEADPTRQALLEVYVAIVLKAKYNDFDTH